MVQVKNCAQASGQFVVIRSRRGFSFTGWGHVNMRKAEDRGHSTPPLTAVAHSSFCTHRHNRPGCTANRMPWAAVLPAATLSRIYVQQMRLVVLNKVPSFTVCVTIKINVTVSLWETNTNDLARKMWCKILNALLFFSLCLLPFKSPTSLGLQRIKIKH